MTSLIVRILMNVRFETNSAGVTTDNHAAPFEPAFAVASNGTVTDLR